MGRVLNQQVDDQVLIQLRIHAAIPSRPNAPISSSTSSNHSWRNLPLISRLSPALRAPTVLSDQLALVSCDPNIMGAYTTYEDWMFAGAASDSVYIYNCTPNSIVGPTDAVQAITVSHEQRRYLPSVTHF